MLAELVGLATSVKVASDSSEDFAVVGGDRSSDVDGCLHGESVLQENIMPASVWYGEAFGIGMSGINTPGGNAGALIRMYQPRFGLCIVQQTVELALS